MKTSQPAATRIARHTAEAVYIRDANLVTRLIYDSVPEGVAARVAQIATRAAQIATRTRAQKQSVHGFGHPHLRPDDPRTPRLFEIAQGVGVPGRHIAALKALSVEVGRVYGRHLTINVTGAIAAVLGEIGVPRSIMRGIAVISRSAARNIWQLVDQGIPYEKGAS